MTDQHNSLESQTLDDGHDVFAERGNAVLELKTKSDCIEELLDLEPRGRTVVSWSLSPESVAVEEYGTASIEAREGFGGGLHHKMVIECEDGEDCHFGGHALHLGHDFDCGGADDCEVMVKCGDDGDCDCTVNGEEADCKALHQLHEHGE